MVQRKQIDMLTGKCKEDFEKWYMKDVMGYKDPRHYSQWFDLEMERFYSHLFSCKYGVYVDFFDSVGIIIEIEYFGESSWSLCVYSNDVSFELIPLQKTPRPKARQKAIEKANEIYNQQYGNK